MTTEQRRALGGAIPTTEVIKDAVTFPRDRLGEPLDISPERFEAWLARVRRDAAKAAWDEAIEEALDGWTIPASGDIEAVRFILLSTNPYMPEETP